MAAKHSTVGKQLELFGLPARATRRNKWFTKDEQALAVKMHADGQVTRDIAASLGCTPQGIVCLLRRLGVPMKPPGKRLSDQDYADMRVLYKAGSTVSALAEKYKCSEGRVREILNAGVVVIVHPRYAMSSAARETVVGRHLAGESVTSIAADLGVKYENVYHLIRKRGVKVRLQERASGRTPEVEQAIRERFPIEGGMPIAKDLGLKSACVYRWAQELGVSAANKGGNLSFTKAVRNTSVNWRYFETWSPNMAYVLGYLWADGNVLHADRGAGACSIQLKCMRRDEALILAVAGDMGWRGRVARFDHHGPTGDPSKSFAASSIRLSSRILVECLMRQHGILPNKTSLDLPFPSVPDAMAGHFFRGVFDGDGCVTCRGPKTGMLSADVSGSRQFIDGLRRRAASLLGIGEGHFRETVGCWRVWWTRQDDIRGLTRWMYPPGDYIFLARKRELMERSLAPRTPQKKARAASFHKRIKKWSSSVSHRGHVIHLGYYDIRDEAHFAMDVAFTAWHGAAALTTGVQEGDLAPGRGEAIRSFVLAKIAT